VTTRLIEREMSAHESPTEVDQNEIRYALAEHLGNTSSLCKVMGYIRDSFYLS